tara:strand:- start:3869 stop:4117 length:249 start_codon:yes stop_codon:yes gene_type:complete
MPLYEFIDTETEEVEEVMLSISEYDQWLIDNPTKKRYYSQAPAMSYSGFKSKESRAGDGWKEVQDRIRSGMPKRLRGNIKQK